MAKVAVLGAAGYAGAIAAQILYRHPFFELSAVTARAEAGQRLDDVHPKTRVPLELELYSDQTADAAIVAYPHGAAAPVVAELRSRGVRVVDLCADFRLPRPDHVRRLVRRAQGARDLRAGRLRAPGAHARGRQGRRSGRQPGLLPDGGAARAGAAGEGRA